MVRIVTVDDIKSLIRKVTLEKFFTQLVERLEATFSCWEEFEKMPRVVSSVEGGVIELMPFWNKDYYSFKYVNGHPSNSKDNKQTVVGIGMLADAATGYPVLISEMTLLTAIRTAATSVLASKYIAKPKPRSLAIVGTGAQSEFQIIAHKTLFDIKTVYYFDLDSKAMDKFEKNLSSYECNSGRVNLERAKNVESMIEDVDIIITVMASRKFTQILRNEWIKPGMIINTIGENCTDRTALDPKILERSKIVVEFLKQSKDEGAIQNYNHNHVYAELWELTEGKKLGRTSDEEIFVFDLIGFALEDYVTLRLVYSLAEAFHVGHMLDMVPEEEGINPKNLFGLLVD